MAFTNRGCHAAFRFSPAPGKTHLALSLYQMYFSQHTDTALLSICLLISINERHSHCKRTEYCTSNHIWIINSKGTRCTFLLLLATEWVRPAWHDTTWLERTCAWLSTPKSNRYAWSCSCLVWHLNPVWILNYFIFLFLVSEFVPCDCVFLMALCFFNLCS